MVAILDHQIESFERSAGEVAPMPQGARALEDLIDVGVALFEALRSVVARWQERARSGLEPLEIQDAREMDSFYRRLAAVFDHAAPLIDALERAGERIAGSNRFREARRDLLSITSLSLDRLLLSEEQLQGRESRPLGEVMSELRRRHHA